MGSGMDDSGEQSPCTSGLYFSRVDEQKISDKIIVNYNK